MRTRRVRARAALRPSPARAQYRPRTVPRRCHRRELSRRVQRGALESVGRHASRTPRSDRGIDDRPEDATSASRTRTSASSSSSFKPALKHKIRVRAHSDQLRADRQRRDGPDVQRPDVPGRRAGQLHVRLEGVAIRVRVRRRVEPSRVLRDSSSTSSTPTSTRSLTPRAARERDRRQRTPIPGDWRHRAASTSRPNLSLTGEISRASSCRATWIKSDERPLPRLGRVRDAELRRTPSASECGYRSFDVELHADERHRHVQAERSVPRRSAQVQWIVMERTFRSLQA